MNDPEPDMDGAGRPDALPATPSQHGFSERSARTLAALLAATSLVACAAAALRKTGADEDIFRYVGYAWAHGDLPYRDAFENKPPGIFLVWLLVWKVAGGAPLVGRALGLAATCGAALLVARMANRLWPSRRGAWAGLLFVAAACDRELQFPFADTETFGVFFAVAGLALVWPGEGEAPGPFRYLLSGVLCGVALTFKPVFAVEVAAVAGLGLVAHHTFRRRALVVCATFAGSVMPLAACFAYFASHGIASEFVEVAFGALSQAGTLPSGQGSAATGPAWRLTIGVARLIPKLSLPIIVALLAAGLSIANGERRRAQRPILLLLAAWFLVALAGIAAQGWAWGHQFKQLLPPLCILAVGALTTGSRGQAEPGGASRSRLAEVLLLLGMFLSLMGLVHRALMSVTPEAPGATTERPGPSIRQYESPEDAIATLTVPGDRIWCYPRSNLYVDTRRLSAARHFTPIFLSVPGAQAETLTRLTSGQARLVLIDWPRIEARRIDPSFAAQDRPAFHDELREVLGTSFRVCARADEWTVYERSTREAR